MVKRGSQTLVFALAFVAWLLLTWRVEFASVLVGVVVALVAAFLFGELFTVTPFRALQPERYFWFVYYLPIFLWEVVKANFDVAYRVLHPKLPINPGLVKIRTNLKSEVSKAFLANSITLTPGTMTVDIKDEELYIHWIDVKAKTVEEASRIISEKFEKIIARIFE
ncbi:MAG: Na+/H+ antiporter subunit E [Candidatus Margulisiibacteriota bacterium]